MSSLRLIERNCVEQLFGMADGYVLDFSNRTFGQFVRTAAGVDIYSGKYEISGHSKANRLRAFIELEDDSLVGKVLSEMLEYWRDKTPQPDASSMALAERAKGIVQRLLKGSAQLADPGREFLKQDFGALSLGLISTAGPLVSTLEARLAEAIRCHEADAPLAVIFHCGSILEGLLLGLARAHAKQFNQAPNSPKDKLGVAKPFQEWTLAQFIDVSCELGHLGQDVKKFSHALRDFRNYIHPYQQMSARFQPDKHTAEICLQVLRAAIASLSAERM